MTDQVSDTEILKKSVTASDVQDYNGGLWIRLPFHLWGMTADDMLPQRLPSYWSTYGIWNSKREFILRSTIQHEDYWAGAVGIATTKVACKSWEVKGDVPLRVKRSQEMLKLVNFHGGWVNLMSQTVMDYLLTNNGWFIEIVRASSALNSQILGLVHLDSLRAIRTGDPETPVVYRDQRGALHELKPHQVIYGSDMPDPMETWFGIGHCAAERSYRSITKIEAIENYVYEKITGRRPKKLSFVNMANVTQLKNAILGAEGEADQKGYVAYMGAVIIPVPGEKPPGVAEVEVAGLPEDFERKQELDLALLDYGNNIGLDPQELQPLSGQPLGTATQSQVLDDKQQGRGLQAFLQDFSHQINWWVIPDLTTFAFVEKDYRDRLNEANINKTEIDTQANAVDKALITAQQGVQYLVDKNIYPEEFIPADLTPETGLGDDEKPTDGEGQSPADGAISQQPAAPAEPAPATSKEAGDAAAILKGEMEAAKKLYEEAASE